MTIAPWTRLFVSLTTQRQAKWVVILKIFNISMRTFGTFDLPSILDFSIYGQDAEINGLVLLTDLFYFFLRPNDDGEQIKIF